MTAPRFAGKNRPVTASMVREALGDALGKIRAEEGYTWVELGELLGKGDDAVARYVDASADMPVSTFYKGKALWNGRFTGAADKLIEEARGEVNPYNAQSCILKAALALSVALEDGVLTNAEIAANRADLERSRDAIDALLFRLAPREVA